MTSEMSTDELAKQHNGILFERYRNYFGSFKSNKYVILSPAWQDGLFKLLGIASLLVVINYNLYCMQNSIELAHAVFTVFIEIF